MDINELGRMRTPGYLLPMATAPKPAGATPPNILDLGPAAARNRLTTWAPCRRGDRIGPHPVGRSPHPLHLVAMRLRPGVRLLRHRDDGVPAEPHPVRD